MKRFKMHLEADYFVDADSEDDAYEVLYEMIESNNSTADAEFWLNLSVSEEKEKKKKEKVVKDGKVRKR